MTEAMPFLQKYDITFLRPPTICQVLFFTLFYACSDLYKTVKVIVFIPNRLSGQLLGHL